MISDSDSCIGKIEVKMDSSIGEAVELISTCWVMIGIVQV